MSQNNRLLTDENLRQAIADYLTGQFITEPANLPADESLSEADHILALMAPYYAAREAEAVATEREAIPSLIHEAVTQATIQEIDEARKEERKRIVEHLRELAQLNIPALEFARSVDKFMVELEAK